MIYNNPVMPLFYHGPMKSTKGATSDRSWVESRMAVIPPAEQQEIAARYSQLYLTAISSDGRERANTYLQSKAQPYINAIKEARSAKKSK